MRFLFVQKIHSMTSSTISGEMTFGEKEPWRSYRADLSGTDWVRVSVISEAIGQLVSWLSLRNTDFSGRPVFLFATSIDLSRGVPVGSTVQLEAEITDESKESFVFSGRAKLGDQIIAEVKDCGGYLMPLGDLENPETTRERFAALTTTGLPLNPSGEAYDLSSLVDAVDEMTLGESIKANKVFTASEPFYADHFPRFPVTPIVVINEMIGEVTSRMMCGDGSSSFKLEPVAVQDLKIKSFIKPGDIATVSVRKIEDDGNMFETIAEVSLVGRRILRGRYRYLRVSN